MRGIHGFMHKYIVKETVVLRLQANETSSW